MMTEREFAHVVTQLMARQPDEESREKLEAYLAAALDEARGDYDLALDAVRQLLAIDSKGGEQP